MTSHSHSIGATAVVDGYRITFYVIAAVNVATAVLALMLMKPAEAPRPRQRDKQAANGA
ncbi:hypothetical protein ACIREM_38550 [Streptomyces shenzhenensis]|uniref:hypothetical protein n=1 Tax=Streptomyces shenzhenensis TaxID=943815 RepID=UPI003808F0E8